MPAAGPVRVWQGQPGGDQLRLPDPLRRRGVHPARLRRQRARRPVRRLWRGPGAAGRRRRVSARVRRRHPQPAEPAVLQFLRAELRPRLQGRDRRARGLRRTERSPAQGRAAGQVPGSGWRHARHLQRRPQQHRRARHLRGQHALGRRQVGRPHLPHLEGQRHLGRDRLVAHPRHPLARRAGAAVPRAVPKLRGLGLRSVRGGQQPVEERRLPGDEHLHRRHPGAAA